MRYSDVVVTSLKIVGAIPNNVDKMRVEGVFQMEKVREKV